MGQNDYIPVLDAGQFDIYVSARSIVQMGEGKRLEPWTKRRYLKHLLREGRTSPLRLAGRFWFNFRKNELPSKTKRCGRSTRAIVGL